MNITLPRAVVQAALECVGNTHTLTELLIARNGLRTALAQPQAEPAKQYVAQATGPVVHVGSVMFPQVEAQPATQQPAGWQPIETAPKDERLLLWGKFWNGRDEFTYPLIGKWHASEDRFVILGEMRFGVRPTHWMPLPPAPGEAQPATQPAPAGELVGYIGGQP